LPEIILASCKSVLGQKQQILITGASISLADAATTSSRTGEETF